MRTISLAAAQFEHADGDKAANLAKIQRLSARAKEKGAALVAFHECCITGYTYLQSLAEPDLRALAEPVPDGPSLHAIHDLARKLDLALGVGLIELAPDDSLRKCFAVVGPDGLIARHHKLHPFIHPAITPGEQFTTFDFRGVRFGILICYDCNLPENVRATALAGAQVILAPHVTGCTPSTMPGRGTVDRALWDNRERDPDSLRREFDGPKARAWLMRWLPARAWENGVFVVFANAVGIDGGTVKPGLAMILDPHGEVIAESRALGDDVVVATCPGATFDLASGRRYLRARRPELYEPLVRPAAEPPLTKPGWTLDYER